jgi:broad specificity phosphatase PhoE
MIATLMRHGETEWNAEGRFTSSTEVELSEMGVDRVRRHVAVTDFSAYRRVISSPRIRAIQTAEIVAALNPHLQPIQVSDELREVDFGAFEGLTGDEITQTHLADEFLSWRSGATGSPSAPGGESWQAAENRADSILSQLSASGVDTLLVSHGYFARLVVVRAIGPFPAPTLRRLRSKNGRLTDLEHSSPFGWVLTNLNR